MIWREEDELRRMREERDDMIDALEFARFMSERHEDVIKVTPVNKRVAKRPDNEFKVRWEFRNNLNQSTFKITKKFWLDIGWCYKVKYESGNELLFTEHHFKTLLEQGRFRRIHIKKKIKESEHFDDGSLFRL